MRKRAAPPGPTPGLHHAGDEVHLLREVMRTHQVLVGTYARALGAPAARMGLMRLLAIAQGRLGTNALARRLGVNPAAVTRQLNELEREGLAIRTADARDGRRSSVALTPRGLEAFHEIHDRGHAFERALATELSAAELEIAVRVLQRLRHLVLRTAGRADEEEEP